MVDVTLLGCGGSIPLKDRWLTSCLVRYEGKCILIDCGEGTQIALKSAGHTFKPIDIICFTHYHADHISGLPGFLLSMGNAGRTEPLELIGPPGLAKTVNALRVIAPEIPFDIKYTELSGAVDSYNIGPFVITAYRLLHAVTCYGYRIDIPRIGKFDVSRAIELGLPKNLWGVLQNGNSVEFEGNMYVPQDVLGPERKGITVAYCTDSRPVERIKLLAKGADLFICEGLYGDDEKQSKTAEKCHMTYREAANLAKAAEADCLWLTHYSPAMTEPEEFLEKTREIFTETYCGFDGKTTSLQFEE